MTMMSNLPRDLLEEILSRAPADSMRAIRLTCKKWNTLTEEESFRKKQLLLAKAAKEFMVVMLMNSMVCLVSINLHKEDDVIKCNGKLINLTDVSQVFHCGGLVCITNGFTNTRDVLWNPYWGQTRWIEARSRHAYIYAIGYETKKSCRSYKIVSSANYYIDDKRVDYEIYELDSNSWRVLDLNSDWATAFYKMEVSVKGNSYTYTRAGGRGEFLICFDFTTEGFGPALPLPFHSHRQDIVALSSVREEQLAVLCQRYDTLHMEIWISSKIEPNDVSWRKLLLAVDMKPLTVCYGNFFVDEEKKVAVVFDKDKEIRHRNTAYIIGENGYLRKVDLGESQSFLVGCSYVPSSVQIKQLAKGKSN